MTDFAVCIGVDLSVRNFDCSPILDDDRCAIWGVISDPQLVTIRQGLEHNSLQVALSDCSLESSIVILDKLHRKVSLVRDALGLTTLLYFEEERRLAIATSVSLLKHMGLPLRPDYIAGAEFVMTHYRYHRANPTRTLFHNVHGMAPGEMVKWPSVREMKPYRYWTPNTGLHFSDKEEWFGRYRVALADGIENALAGLVTPAFALSSGMDSGTVASLATQTYGPIKLVTTRFDERTIHDETSDVGPTARALGGDWIQVPIGAADVQSAFRQTGDGFADWPASTVTQVLHGVLLNRLSDLGIDGLISGLGGDEVNCGEIEEYLFYFADLYASGNSAKLDEDIDGWIRYHSTLEYPKSREALQAFFATGVNLQISGRIRPNSTRYWQYADCLDPEVVEVLGYKILVEPYESYLLNKLFQDLFYETIPPVLDLEQSNVRTSSVVTRYPFLTTQMVDIGFSTDRLWRYKDGVSKAALRGATEGLVPASARLNYSKRGWNAPLDIWLRESMGSEVRSLLTEARVRQRGVYNEKRIAEVLHEHLTGVRNHMMFLWQFIAYERWLAEVENWI